MIETVSPLHILLVDDHENERLLFRRAFQQSDIPCEITGCANVEQAMERLDSDASSFDIVVVDGSLPGITGMDLCRKLLDEKVPLPLVFSTETGLERLAAEAIRSGVHDYIIKDPKGGYLELLPILLINVARRYEEYQYYKQTNETIQDNNRAAHAFLESMPDIAGMIDINENVLMINKAGAESLGKRVDEIIGRNAREIISGEVYELRRAKWTQAFQTGKTQYMEDERDGKYFETWFCPVFDTKGKVVSIATFAHDITNRKKTEEELRKSEMTYRSLVEQLPAITYIAALDESSTTLYVSPQVKDLIGFTVEEYKSDPDIWRKQLHPDDRDHVLKTVKQCHTEKKPFTEEYRMITKNGDIVWFRDEAVIVKDEKNRPLFLQGVMYDMTQHKHADEEIRKFKTLADKSGHGVALSDLEGNMVYVNESFARMHQYGPEELIGKNLSIFHNEEQMEHVNQLIEQTKQQGGFTAEEVWHSKKDKTIFPTLMSVTLIRDESGEPLFLAGTALDMTKHKKTEKALQESEVRYQILFGILPVGVGLSTIDGHIIDINSTFQQMLGYATEEIKRINVNDTYYNPAERMPYVKKLQQDGFVHGYEARLKRKDDTIFIANMNATTMRMCDETVLVTVAMDITKQRSMEKALAESEEKYRTLVECAGDPIFTIDEKGVFLFANKRAEKDFNNQRDSLEGKTLWDLFPKKIANRKAANVRKVIETGQGTNTVSLTEIKGKPCWYNVTIEPLRDDRGNVNAAMVIARNIDDIKRAEEQIKKLSSAIESSINGIAIGDAKGNLTYVNRSFLKLWGYDDENEVLERNAIEFWQIPDEGSKVINTLLDKKGWIGELTAKRKNGSTFDAQVCGTLVTDENNKPISMMGSFIDITELKRREEELTRYREQMARAEQLASLGTLSATIAHQLTQPLTVIRLSIDNALDELESSSSSPTVIRRLKDSVTQVSNITSIIERFRNFARKSSGRTVTEVNLKAVAVRIAGLLSESARSAGIVLRIRNMDDLPCPWMNENDLEQLFFALIDNAIQAADGKKTRQLVISGAAKDKDIELRLSDNCGGIVPENIDKIFEPFFTTKPPGQGTGLGLCIVKDIISRIGGHVRVESKFGKGTTFIINIPIEKDKIS